MKSQTIVFLVRHAQTSPAPNNDPSLYDRRILNEEGRAQAKKIGEYLADFGIAKIYTSPTKRTQETADMIYHISGCSSEPVVEKKLNEIYNNAEFENIDKTGVSFIENIVRHNNGKQIVLVSHMLVIAELLKKLGADESEMQLPCQQGEMYRLVFAEDKFVECQKISL
ncbi:MAG TPA: histidine phosphatase family protein [Candidatus Saccharimonadales bacterium]|nr:histidine phosphatase family protein [Candidatus Saccharimonadales bacterium]